MGNVVIGRIERNERGDLELVLEDESVLSVVDIHQVLPAPQPNTFYQNVIKARIPCAYGSKECVGHTFAPNGVGSKQHTTCERGRKALVAARAKA